jgi:4-hydroxy-tetrahydrodipicolinate synthase
MPDPAAAVAPGNLVAATLTPWRPDGRLDLDVMRSYVAALRADGADGAAVAVHTGRGHLLGEGRRRDVVAAAVDAGLPVVAGVGGGAAGSIADLRRRVVREGREAAEGGAQALLVSPPPRDDGDGAVLDLHRAVADGTGLPLVAFVLYEAASGHQYSADLAVRLAAMPEVAGIKVALLDDAVTCQDVLFRCRDEAPGCVRITGEDRMFGPSLTWGAQASLMGISAALTSLGVRALRGWRQGRYAEFLDAAAEVDALARLTFHEPMAGYVRRMGWVAAWQGLLPDEVVVDPGSEGRTVAGERESLVAALDRTFGRLRRSA